METIKLIGYDGRMIMVRDNIIKIVQTPVALAKRWEKLIDIDDVTGVEVRKNGTISHGYIQITTPGVASESPYGSEAVNRHENTVFFRYDHCYKTALQMQKYILQYKKRGQQPTSAASEADELMKYKKLLDAGAITPEEYDAKKKQLLGL